MQIRQNIFFFILSFIAFGRPESLSPPAACGGAIKLQSKDSLVPLPDFSQVKIELKVSSTGLIKERISILTKGLFSFPIYDTGSYDLVISVPEGWTVLPKYFNFEVKSGQDSCSEHFDFVVKGFSVQGATTFQTDTPLYASLTDSTLGKLSSGHVEVRPDGQFILVNVPVGDYFLQISERSNSEEPVRFKRLISVMGKNVILKDILKLSGQRVSGKLPKKGRISLFARTKDADTSDITQSCKKVPAEIKTPDPKYQHALCVLDTEEDGTYRILGLPSGSYLLMPIVERNQEYKLDKPFLVINLENAHLDELNFHVKSLTFDSGLVLNAQSKPLSNAIVILDGKPAIKTDSAGKFRLLDIPMGEHTLSITHDGMEFTDRLIMFNLDSPKPDSLVFAPAKLQLCMQFSWNSDGPIQMPKVIISSEEHTHTMQAQKKLCHFLTPGHYSVSLEGGAAFSPNFHTVDLTTGPVTSGVHFSLFRATLSGMINLQTDAKSLLATHSPKARLVALNSDSSDTMELQLVASKTDLQVLDFSMSNLVSGSYRLVLSSDRAPLCLENESGDLVAFDHFTREFSITDMNIVVIIRQAGLFQTILLPNLLNRPVLVWADKFKWLVEAPGAQICLPQKVKKLHFKTNNYKLNTVDVSPKEPVIKLNIHKLSFGVNVLPLDKYQVQQKVRIVSSAGTDPLDLDLNEKGEADGMIWLLRDQKLDKISLTTSQLTPTGSGSEVTLSFKPAKIDVIIEKVFDRVAATTYTEDQALPFVDSNEKATISTMKNLDTKFAVTFNYVSGVYLVGKIQPPLEGVTVEVYQRVPGGQLQELLASTTTKSQSPEFRVGPVPPAANMQSLYLMELAKLGYIFVRTDEDVKSNTWNFQAKQLAMLKVQMTVEKQPLPGVLVSVINDERFRKNEISNDLGQITMVDLPEGEYYVQPMLKEFAFHTQSGQKPPVTVQIKDGKVAQLDIQAKRVAYSILGQVLSLANLPLSDLVVQADSVEGAKCVTGEQASTSKTGAYRLRGLTIGCKYAVKLVGRVESSLPEVIHITMTNKDVEGINFRALPKMQMGQITALLKSPKDVMHRVSLVVCAENRPATVLYRHSFTRDSLLFVLDGDRLNQFAVQRTGLILSLEHDLSPHHYVNITGSVPKFSVDFNQLGPHPQAHFVMEFNPIPKVLN